MSFAQFFFTGTALNSTVVDCTGQPLYKIVTENKTWSTPPTRVYRANGCPVGTLAWGGLTHSQKITLGGATITSLVKRKRDKWTRRSQWAFTDENGTEFLWRGLQCFTADSEVIAVWKREEDHPSSDEDEENSAEKTSLSVDQPFLYMLDLILFTALEMEARRRSESSMFEDITPPPSSPM
ncbi:hypothetical protein FRB99_000966 [Tulasnella sp. 403]|nr:hypothetical protein FRB99_000966 [Tulasnella sp. 403]